MASYVPVCLWALSVSHVQLNQAFSSVGSFSHEQKMNLKSKEEQNITGLVHMGI